MDKSFPVVHVCGKKTSQHVIDCICQFNRNYQTIIIRGVGSNILQAVEVSRILQHHFGAIVSATHQDEATINGVSSPILDIHISLKDIQMDSESSSTFNNSFFDEFQSFGHGEKKSIFLPYPVYQTLFDWHLSQTKSIKINLSDKETLLAIELKNNKLAIHRPNYTSKSKAYYPQGLEAALLRSGLLLHSNWKSIAAKISSFDDVILGIDTNILYNCIISEQLLPSLSIINNAPYMHTPNWVLIVIPSTVIFELEQSTNIREEKGFLQPEGRLGYRALQEIIDLNQGSDIAGVSILVVGEAKPQLDAKIELQGWREDSYKRYVKEYEQSHPSEIGKMPSLRSRKKSTGDMIIRDEFKSFLRQIDFHKGIYFLTSDKSNAALARAEGLHPILFQSPHTAFMSTHEYKETDIDSEIDNLVFPTPVGKLIYELALQFSQLTLNIGKENYRIGCDCKGDDIDNWTQRTLIITQEDLWKLMNSYNGLFDISKTFRVWKQLFECFSIKDF